MSSRSFRWLAIIALSVAALLSRRATAQVFQDRLVQAPSLSAPERGSVAGTLAGLSFAPGGLSQGGFALPLPVSAPGERGPLLASVFPSYSPDRGVSEWGMGWGAALSIRRFRVVGDLDYATDDFATPWGRVKLGDDGAYYPLGHSGRMRLVLADGAWVARTPTGTEYVFRAGDAVVTPRGTYEWMLSEVRTLEGDRTFLTWVKNASGRAFLSRVEYGGRGALQQYELELAYQPLVTSLESWASGERLVLDRRVSAVHVRVRPGGAGAFQSRWRYDLGYVASPFGPGFYLSSLQRAYRSGEQDPPITYTYALDTERLPAARLARDPAIDDFLTKAGDDAIQPGKSALVDLDEDGRLDLEHAAKYTLVRHTDSGWVYEALPPATGVDTRCRRAPSSANPPRHLARMLPDAAAPHVVHTELSGAAGSSRVLVCDRAGVPLYNVTHAGNWQLGANVKLVDLDRDRRPDLIRVQPDGVQVLMNQSSATSFSFVARPFDPIAFGFAPEASWIHDLDGDGLVDLVLRRPDGITVHHGRGGFRFDSTGRAFTIVNRNGGAITALGAYQTYFVDANRDGLTDLVLSGGTGTFLFTNRGDRFVEVVVAGLASLSTTMGAPVVADLSAQGNIELAFASGKQGWHLQLGRADTGLLVASDDGKGARVGLTYTRSEPVPGLEQRTILVASVTVEASGQDPVTTYYDYEEPIAHTKGGFLAGFAVTRRVAPLVMDEVRFHHDDEVSGVVLETVTTDARSDVYHFTRTSYEERVHRGIRWWRPTVSEEGLRNLGDISQLVTRTENLVHEREFCPTRVRITSEHGTLVLDTALADPAALAGLPHCQAQVERMRGLHADGALDFEYLVEADRDALGKVTALRQLGASGYVALQHVTYDALHRITGAVRPGLGTVQVTYDPSTGLVQRVTAPDAVATGASVDPITDAMVELGVDRGAQGSWARFYRHDGLERLWKSWDDLGAATEANPEAEFAYRYARADGPGAITARQLVDASTGSRRTSATLYAASGEAVATVTATPDAWAVSDLARVLVNENETTSYRRAPMVLESSAGGGSIPEIAWYQLMAGASSLGTSRRDGADRTIFDTAILQTGVVRELSTSHVIVDGALVSTAVENGTHVVQRGTDAAGKPVWQQDAAGSVTRMRYDVLGRLVRVELPDGELHTATFDSYGRPSQVSRAGLASVRYAYDPASGLPVKREVLTANGAVERSVVWTRDAIGRVVSETHAQPASGVTRTFHHRWDGDRGDGTTVPGQRGHHTQVDGAGFLRRTVYRRDGAVGESTLRLGAWRELQQERTYFEDGALKEQRWTVRDGGGTIRHAFTQTRVVDAYGRLAELRVDGAPLATIVYDVQNRLARVDLVSGESVAYHYDPVTAGPSGYWQDGGAWNGGVDWTLSARGLVASEAFAFGDETTQRDYEYDARGFLVASGDGADDSVYAYDAAGLPTHTADSLGARDLVRAGTTLVAGDHVYTYDTLGRVVARDDLALAYGPTGQIDVARRGGRTWGYVHDEAGNRLYKHENGQPTEAYLDGAYLDDSTFVVPLELAGRVIGVYEVGAAGAQLRLLPTDPRSTLLGDGGTPLLPTPFGARQTRPSLARALDFAARGYDADLGAVRFGVRDYDAYLGQFWTPDPRFLEAIDKVAASPVDGNLYAYARNNPLSLVDPSGLEPTYTITVRRYAEPAKFGGGFDGDSRGPSTSPDATSRTRLQITFDTSSQSVVGVRGDASPSALSWYSRLIPVTWGKPSDGQAHVDASAQVDWKGFRRFDISGQSAGSNPLVWQWVSPDINTYIRFSVVATKSELQIAGTLSGNCFPWGEYFITDSAGNSMMLGSFQAFGSPAFNLWGEASDAELNTFTARIALDEDGRFTRSGPHIIQNNEPAHFEALRRFTTGEVMRQYYPGF
ncbi:MAG TPA: RHS repeat-associated core domain-containing protein [Kofleriaceae bacterium]|nr:RHS repeat-associated core domain-containing protein [Kofleriaceae bacterium]